MKMYHNRRWVRVTLVILAAMAAISFLDNGEDISIIKMSLVIGIFATMLIALFGATGIRR